MLFIMHNFSNFIHNATTVFFLLNVFVEFDLIGEDEYEIGFFDLYVVSPPLSTMRASYQTLIVHRQDPSDRGYHAPLLTIMKI